MNEFNGLHFFQRSWYHSLKRDLLNFELFCATAGCNSTSSWNTSILQMGYSLFRAHRLKHLVIHTVCMVLSFRKVSGTLQLEYLRPETNHYVCFRAQITALLHNLLVGIPLLHVEDDLLVNRWCANMTTRGGCMTTLTAIVCAAGLPSCRTPLIWPLIRVIRRRFWGAGALPPWQHARLPRTPLKYVFYFGLK